MNKQNHRKFGNKERARREKLFMIIGQHINDWTPYGDIVDVIKKESLDMYKFKEGVCRYVSPELMDDLDSLWLDFSWIKKTEHFRKERNIIPFHHITYRISDLGRIVLRDKEKQTMKIGIMLGEYVIISPETIDSLF